MKWLKYVLSGFVIVLLTAAFMFSPDIYYYQLKQSEYQPKIHDITVERSEQLLSSNELFRAFLENHGTGIFSAAENSKTTTEYLADCTGILNDMFGGEENSPLTKMLMGQLDSENCEIQTEKFLTLLEGQAVVLNLVSVSVNDLYIYYIDDLNYTGINVAVQVWVLNMEDYLGYELNEYSAALDKSVPEIEEYYHSFGLKDGEFDYSAYNSVDGWKLFVGLIYNEWEGN